MTPWCCPLMHLYAHMQPVYARYSCLFKSRWLWLQVLGKVIYICFWNSWVLFEILRYGVQYLLFFAQQRYIRIIDLWWGGICISLHFYCRYEIGRLDRVSWQRWNENLRMIASNPYNTIAANNRYDLVRVLLFFFFFFSFLIMHHTYFRIVFKTFLHLTINIFYFLLFFLILFVFTGVHQILYRNREYYSTP